MVDLGADSPQVLLQVDEAGVATWHFPQPAAAMAPGTLEFSVPREVATAPIDGAAEAGDRGLAAMIGRKLLSVLVFRSLEAGVGLLARVLADKYEKRRAPTDCARSHRVRPAPPGPGTWPTAVGTASTAGPCCWSTAPSPPVTAPSPGCLTI